MNGWKRTRDGQVAHRSARSRSRSSRTAAATVAGMTDHTESSGAPHAETEVRTLPAERLKAFSDAVVAIAMTLLILPLMESVRDVAAHDLSTWEWLNENAGQLLSFALSFVLIANFWLTHHR